jgi:hypothetical protein
MHTILALFFFDMFPQASIWLHRGAYGCARALVMQEPTDSYVAYCLKVWLCDIEAHFN